MLPRLTVATVMLCFSPHGSSWWIWVIPCDEAQYISAVPNGLTAPFVVGWGWLAREGGTAGDGGSVD